MSDPVDDFCGPPSGAVVPIARGRLQTYSADALLALKIPPTELLLAPWLREKSLILVHAWRGVGKTHMALGVSYAVASGGAFLSWRAASPRRVLHLDGEMPADALQQRLASIIERNGPDAPSPQGDALTFLPMDLQERGFDLSDPADQRDLEPFLDGRDLVTVDNISSLVASGRENEAESWLPIQQWALRQRRKGRAVLFMHHDGKGGAQRGTSRREDVLDVCLGLKLPSDYSPEQGARFEVRFEKARHLTGAAVAPFEAALGQGGWTTKTIDDANLARVHDLTTEGLTVRDIADELGLSKSAVSRLQKKSRGQRSGAPDREAGHV